jgi:hypothetical protein
MDDQMGESGGRVKPDFGAAGRRFPARQGPSSALVSAGSS